MLDTDQTKLYSLTKNTKKKNNYVQKDVTYNVKECKKITAGRLYPTE